MKDRGLVLLSWLALLGSLCGGLLSVGAIMYCRAGLDAQTEANTINRKANELHEDDLKAQKEFTAAINKLASVLERKVK